MTTASFSVSRMGSISCSDCGVLLCTKSLIRLIPRTYDFSPLIRLTSKAIKHLLDVHVAGDKLRALVEHAPQHSFSSLVDERDVMEIHDAPSALSCAACPLPIGLQFLDPGSDEAALQRPQFLLRGGGDRNFQHPFLLPGRWIMQMQGQKSGSAPRCATARPADAPVPFIGAASPLALSPLPASHRGRIHGARPVESESRRLFVGPRHH